MRFDEIEGSTSAELRTNFLERTFRPLAADVFNDDATVQSLVLAIGQYWADEAHDAVHLEVVPCTVADPDWPACLRGNPFVDDEDGGQWPSYSATKELIWDRDYVWLDSNSNAITAFASCCHEVVSQEDPLGVAYRPYAIARREGPDYTGAIDPGPAAVEVVGSVLRPAWEDQFDLDDDARMELLDASLPDEPTPSPASPQSPPPPPPGSGGRSAGSRPGFLGRLFGRRSAEGG